MVHYIPFVNGPNDRKILTELYPEARLCRVSLERRNLVKDLQGKMNIWLDPALDGFHHKPENRSEKWKAMTREFAGDQKIADQDLDGLKTKQLDEFVFAVLDHCQSYEPACISVPQLPLLDDTSRHEINRRLAGATGKWRDKQQSPGKLILPVILTDADLYLLKTKRNGRTNLAATCSKKARADGLWIVDSNLKDQSGSYKFSGPNGRFASLIKFHDEVRRAVARKVGKKPFVIAGPYWGMNIVMWARGEADYPAINMGKAYRYYISGNRIQRRPKVRLAIEPLRRWAVAEGEFKKWLKAAIEKIPEDDAAYAELRKLYDNYSKVLESEGSPLQIARFYKKWLAMLEETPPGARSLVLYQDLSSAYALGKTLNMLPKNGEIARKPHIVAERLMLSCL